ncbi:MAG: type II toxin-antitoxin system VapC family toxin [Acidobacteria bacterium]|nr:type II toxin-antitoxin system VapC family toxin [Acidobacteriota bacterium]
MSLLLDTHAFLWFIDDSPRLSAHAKSLLESEAELFLSLASLWEISIKMSVGKLTLPQPYDLFIPQQLAQNDIKILPISIAHLAVVASLPLNHRDPFDRLLIAQAMIEQLPIVSADDHFDAYSIVRLW